VLVAIRGVVPSRDKFESAIQNLEAPKLVYAPR